MTGVFICYRRSDSEDVVGRIYDYLVHKFGKNLVFKDVDSIPLAVSFPAYLASVLSASAVVLVVIGRNWLNCRNDVGTRRIDDPHDYVRIEILTALDRGIPTVPLLVSNARMPSSNELPSVLSGLLEQNGQAVKPDPDFHSDMTRLVRRLGPLVLSVAHDVVATTIDRTSLQEMLMLAQGWYNDIVKTTAEVRQAKTAEEWRSRDFIYINTRTFLPRLLSFRKLLSSTGVTAEVAIALDGFIKLLTFAEEDGDPDEEMLRCIPISDLHRAYSDPHILTGNSRLRHKLYFALQQLSDTVTRLSISS
jgi:hypothetical protein